MERKIFFFLEQKNVFKKHETGSLHISLFYFLHYLQREKQEHF